MPTLLTHLLKNTSDSLLKKAYIIGMISFIFCLIGQYFKIMHWPGAGPMLILGSVLLSVVFLPMYSHAKYKDSSSVQGSFIFLCIGILFFTFLNNLLVLNVSKDIFRHITNQEVKINKNIALIETKINQAILDSNFVKNDQIKKIHEDVTELSKYIYDIKIEIISRSDGIDKKSADTVLRNPVYFLGKNGWDVPTMILIGRNNATGEGGDANKLKLRIEKLKSNILKIACADKNYQKFIQTLLNTPDAYNPQFNKTATWEINTFYHTAAINTLNILSNIELKLKLAESEAIKSMQNGKEHERIALNKITNSSIH